MSISVNFKTQRGIITNRRFELGEGVSIYGTARTLLGLPLANAAIRIDVVDQSGISYFTKETFTDFWSDWSSWFRTPVYNASLTVKVWASFPGGGQDYTEIPIAVGSGSLKPLPAPEVENTLWNWLPYLALIAGGYFLYKTLKD